MPSHPFRYYGSGDLHFITSSCYQRRPLLRDASRRDLFLRVLEAARRRYHFVVLGYVVMPEHFHLLVSEPQRRNLSAVVQGIKIAFWRRLFEPGVAVRKPRALSVRGAPGLADFARPGNPNHFWQARFYDFNVWTERKRIEKLRYIHRNPVKRGLVRSPEEWRWSSFRSYFYEEPGLVRINDTGILVMKIRNF